MDKCRILDASRVAGNLLYKVLTDYHILHIEPNDTGEANAISSEVYTLCFCGEHEDNSCSSIRNETVANVHRGNQFNVSIIALSQGNTVTAPILLARISKTARLALNQGTQSLSLNCTTISYNMYSTEMQESLTLYPNKSCRDQGKAEVVITVDFLPCPDAFNQSGDHCVCEERLQRYNAECLIHDRDSTITRKAGSKFWMSVSYSEGGKYEGLILYHSCPTDYCKSKEVTFSLSHLDAQCDFHHSGKLCGACAFNHSLMLGNSKCQKCSNIHMLLLVAFAAAGVAIVIMLSFLRLTVATGMINSIILYANLVQANKALFFPDSANVNILTVFIAWMNLDLGFPTCFYHAYAQTWLQFVFPIYIWVLISVIILASRYSTVMTKLIGSNPVAVLATLLLMSYAKLLKNIIQIYASVHLDYPNEKTVTVWLKDANVPYLTSQHLHLAIVGSVSIALFFLPYTLLLLLGYRYLRWFMIRMKPLLDSYYAPFEKHTRYWTGLLLLARCALYIVFSFDSIGGTGNSRLAIVTAFTILIVIAWLSVRIYKSSYVNAIEALVYVNLIILTAATSNRANSKVLVYILVGKVFAFMVCIILYHFHVLHIAKTAVWLKIKMKLASCLHRHPQLEEAERDLLVPPPDSGFTTQSVVQLRESLLEEGDN